MAFTFIERAEDRTYKSDWRGVKTFGRGWTVDSDTPVNEVDATAALNGHDPTTLLYAPHPAWPWAVCRDLAGQGGPGKLLKQWQIKASYSTEPFPASGGGAAGVDLGNGMTGGGSQPASSSSNTQPANQRPPTVSIDQEEYTQALEYDLATEAAVVNPAGDKFDPAVEIPYTLDVITWEFFRSASQLNWATRSTYKNTINLESFTLLGKTYPARTLRCTRYSVYPVWETGPAGMSFFWRLVVVAKESPYPWGWQPKILSTGRNKLVSIGGGNFVRQAIIDRSGQPVAEPVALKSDGTEKLPADSFHYTEPTAFFEESWTNLLA